MSIFASYVTRTVPLPFDEPHTVTIQKLSGHAVSVVKEQARVATTSASLELMQAIGGAAAAEMAAGITRSAASAALEQRPVERDQLYHRPTVLAKGVKAWTYDEPITPERLNDLDEQASDFLFHAILDLTLPNGGDAEKKTGS